MGHSGSWVLLSGVASYGPRRGTDDEGHVDCRAGRVAILKNIIPNSINQFVI